MKAVGRFLLLIALVCWTAPIWAQAANIYLANSAVGNKNGTDCNDAYAWTWYNTAANWGTGSGQIGPGTTVHLCGTITGTGSAMTTGMVAQGSGTSANPITIQFESGAILQAADWGQGGGEGECPPCNGALTFNGVSYFVVDGGGTPGTALFGGSTSFCPGSTCGGMATTNGIIQNTANGSNLANQNTAPGIYIVNASNIEIKNLVIRNIYVAVSSESSPGWARPSDDILIDAGTSCSVNIHNNYLNNAGKGLEDDSNACSGSTYNTIHHNLISDHVWQVWNGGNSNDSDYNNELTNWTNWTHPVADYHTDGFMNFGGPTTPYIYNNYIHGNMDPSGTGSATAAIYCTEAGGGAQLGSECTIFNNIIVDEGTAQGYSGYLMLPLATYGNEEGPHYVYNNELINGWALGAYSDYESNGTSVITFLNNIGTSPSSQAVYGVASVCGAGFIVESNYNDYYGFTTYQPCSTDVNSIGGNPNLDSNYREQSGSPTIGAGDDLTSLCTGRLTPLCSDITGNARPTTGPWDIGAYVYGVAPQPPTNLTAVVN